MLLSAFVLILVLGGAIRPLRSGWFALYAVLLVAFSFLAETLFSIDVKGQLFSHHTILWLLCLHLVAVNLTTFAAYYFDKRAAIKNKWRAPERVLHAFAWIGGTPAATLARKLFRHKTAKRSFLLRSWAIALLQLAVIIGLALY